MLIRTVAFTIFVCRTSAADRLAAASAGLADRVLIIPILLIRRYTLLIVRVLALRRSVTALRRAVAGLLGFLAALGLGEPVLGELFPLVVRDLAHAS
jgi:hypothetical protein